METLTPYLFPLLLLPVSLYLISFLRKKGSGNRENLPPGCTSWLRENLAYNLMGSQRFFKNWMQKHSPCPIFRTSLFGQEAAVLCGAQGNKFLFTNENKLVSVWYRPFVTKALFPEFAANTDKIPAALFRIDDLSKPDALRQYIPVMDAAARQLLARPNSVEKMHLLAKKYTFDLSLRLFANVVAPEVLDKLREPFSVFGDGMVALPINFPGTAFNRALKAIELVRAELLRTVKERRKEMREAGDGDGDGEGQDMLTKMLLSSDEDEGYDAVVANFTIGLIVGSFESTAYAITCIVKFLAELPQIYEKVLFEQKEIAKLRGPDEVLTWEDVEKMKYSWNVVRESLRLLPPAVGGFKEATTEFTYAGYAIPKGYKMFWTPYSSHMNPDYFREPEKFDPSRFEGSGPAPYTFVPFGGGPRMCPGVEYARVSILVFMHHLVTRFRLEKATPNEKMLFHAKTIPAQGLPVHLHPHPN